MIDLRFLIIIKIWKHNWGEGIIKDQLRALYTFAIDPDSSLQDFLAASDLAQLFEHTLTEQAEQELQELSIIQHNLRQRVTQPQQATGQTIWKPQPDKGFSVKSAYNTLCDTPRIGSNTKSIWKLKVTPKLKIFAWLLYNNKYLLLQI